MKLSIVDVLCIDARGTRYVVEMQVLNVEAFEKRVVYNVAKTYTNQLEKGRRYPELNARHRRSAMAVRIVVSTRDYPAAGDLEVGRTNCLTFGRWLHDGAPPRACAASSRSSSSSWSCPSSTRRGPRRPSSRSGPISSARRRTWRSRPTCSQSLSS